MLRHPPSDQQERHHRHHYAVNQGGHQHWALEAPAVVRSAKYNNKFVTNTLALAERQR